MSDVEALTANGGIPLSKVPGYDGGVGFTTIEIAAGTKGVLEVEPSTDAVVVNATLGSMALQLSEPGVHLSLCTGLSIDVDANAGGRTQPSRYRRTLTFDIRKHTAFPSDQ